MDNRYNENFEKYLNNMNKKMYIFEVTKCCGYCEMIPVYKTETMFDLYSRISHHFGEIEIKDLFFYTLQGEYIKIPLCNKRISDFVKENISCNPPKLISLYHFKTPLVYSIYLDDGICNSNNKCTCNNINNDE